MIGKRSALPLVADSGIHQPTLIDLRRALDILTQRRLLLSSGEKSSSFRHDHADVLSLTAVRFQRRSFSAQIAGFSAGACHYRNRVPRA